MGIYEVIVRYWDNDEDMLQIVEEVVLYTGKSLEDVAAQVTEYYGVNNITKMSIAALETPLMLDDDILQKWKAMIDDCKSKSEVLVDRRNK